MKHAFKAWIDSFKIHAQSDTKMLDFLGQFFVFCGQYILYLSEESPYFTQRKSNGADESLKTTVISWTEATRKKSAKWKNQKAEVSCVSSYIALGAWAHVFRIFID